MSVILNSISVSSAQELQFISKNSSVDFAYVQGLDIQPGRTDDTGKHWLILGSDIITRFTSLTQLRLPGMIFFSNGPEKGLPLPFPQRVSSLVINFDVISVVDLFTLFKLCPNVKAASIEVSNQLKVLYLDLLLQHLYSLVELRLRLICTNFSNNTKAATWIDVLRPQAHFPNLKMFEALGMICNFSVLDFLGNHCRNLEGIDIESNGEQDGMTRLKDCEEKTTELNDLWDKKIKSKSRQARKFKRKDNEEEGYVPEKQILHLAKNISSLKKLSGPGVMIQVRGNWTELSLQHKHFDVPRLLASFSKAEKIILNLKTDVDLNVLLCMFENLQLMILYAPQVIYDLYALTPLTNCPKLRIYTNMAIDLHALVNTGLIYRN